MCMTAYKNIEPAKITYRRSVDFCFLYIVVDNYQTHLHQYFQKPIQSNKWDIDRTITTQATNKLLCAYENNILMYICMYVWNMNKKNWKTYEYDSSERIEIAYHWKWSENMANVDFGRQKNCQVYMFILQYLNWVKPQKSHLCMNRFFIKSATFIESVKITYNICCQGIHDSVYSTIESFTRNRTVWA